VPDFTSSLYLGMRHESRSSAPRGALMTGVPAALWAPPEAAAVARRLAMLQGCRRTTLATSTLHIAVDLFAQLAAARPAILVDSGAYPILRVGVHLARCAGAAVSLFPRHDPGALRRRLGATRGGPVVVVADGYAAGRGPAPVRAYRDAVREHGGLLVLDDTQALGVLGAAGGGSLRLHRVAGPEVVLVCSLAKGFGAPIACLSGSDAFVGRFEARSMTRVHASPPSSAAIAAAARALAINDARGDLLRARLAAVVRRFRRGLHVRAGLRPLDRDFPVQELGPPQVGDPVRVHERLATDGVACVLRRDIDGSPRIAFVLTARHTAADIDIAVAAIARAIGVARAGRVAA
jgi:8-amino-7-oxononanoate synthase